MSIPYNDNLKWKVFETNPNWHKNAIETKTTATITVENSSVSIAKKAATELVTQVFNESMVRSVQFIRDGARLVLKVPIRSILTPIFLQKNWRELERSKINANLTGHSLLQLISVPFKSFTALAALVVSGVSNNGASWLLEESKNWTLYVDGRASQLEALKEEGAKSAPDKERYKAYKEWLNIIDPKLCRKKL